MSRWSEQPFRMMFCCGRVGRKIMLKPASPGTGIVAGGSARAILEAAGVKDVLAKSLGSSNKVNTAWATIAALKQLKRATDVARLRGKNVNELVSRAVAQQAADAEQEDLAHGIASVVSDEPTVVATAAPPTLSPRLPNRQRPLKLRRRMRPPASEPTTEGGA